MSLNNIQIPAIVLQDLYRNSLTGQQTENVLLSGTTAEKYAFLGDNQQRITIIVNAAPAMYLPDDELNFLLGILAACKLTMADVALLNCAKNPSLNYTGIREQFSAEKIFLFGIEPATIGLPLQFPYYQVQKYNDQVYLSSPALKILENNKAEKTKLWACLKQIFSI